MAERADAREELKSFIERIERIEEERKALSEDKTALFGEAKGRGFDTKVMRRIIKRRKQDPSQIAEEETIEATYMVALGMAKETPLHQQIAALAGDGMGCDQVLETLQQLVPVNGEIIASLGGKPMRLWRTEDGTACAEEYIAPKPRSAERKSRDLESEAVESTTTPRRDPVMAAADRAERRAREAAS